MSEIFSLQKLAKRIYKLTFASRQELAMHFLRYTEFYESPNPRFNEKSFCLADYMSWWCNQQRSASFTYPDSWDGFNLPGKIIKRVKDVGIPDFNRYDGLMLSVHDQVVAAATIPEEEDYYLIGVSPESYPTVKEHELAHAFYYTNKFYANEVGKLIPALPDEVRHSIFEALEELGYSTTVCYDEAQAYLATGMDEDTWESYPELIKAADDCRQPFQNLFERYRNLYEIISL